MLNHQTRRDQSKAIGRATYRQAKDNRLNQRAQLEAAMHIADLIAPNPQWQVLHGGRTNQVWQVAGKRGDLICKLYGDGQGNPLYPNLPGAEYETLKALHKLAIAPEPVALLNTEAGELLVYRKLSGRVGQADPAEAAHLLARLHGLRLDIGLRRLPSGTKALRAQISDILSKCRADLPRVHSLTNAPEVPALERSAVIHTDVVPSNLITTADGLCLIDWQCPAYGDPCEDLASFLSPAMHMLYGNGPLPAEAAQDFLDAYPDQSIVARYQALAPLYHLRIAAYCLWKMENGDQDYAPALQLELSAAKEA